MNPTRLALWILLAMATGSRAAPFDLALLDPIGRVGSLFVQDGAEAAALEREGSGVEQRAYGSTGWLCKRGGGLFGGWGKKCSGTSEGGRYSRLEKSQSTGAAEEPQSSNAAAAEKAGTSRKDRKAPKRQPRLKLGIDSLEAAIPPRQQNNFPESLTMEQNHYFRQVHRLKKRNIDKLQGWNNTRKKEGKPYLTWDAVEVSNEGWEPTQVIEHHVEELNLFDKYNTMEGISREELFGAYYRQHSSTSGAA